jgi:hypothetical protein
MSLSTPIETARVDLVEGVPSFVADPPAAHAAAEAQLTGARTQPSVVGRRCHAN